MSYEARKICNLILSDFNADDYELTNLRINKLLFLMHGWSLARYKTGLVKNHFEAWELGPVVRVVYNAFRHFGKDTIKAQAEHVEYSTGLVTPIAFSDISTEHRELVRKIVLYYNNHSTSMLVTMLHKDGSPWEAIIKTIDPLQTKNALIPDEHIKAYFRELVGDNARH